MVLGGCQREKTKRDDVPQKNNDENIMAKKIASLVSLRAPTNECRESTAAAATVANQSGERSLLYHNWPRLCVRPLISITALLLLVTLAAGLEGQGVADDERRDVARKFKVSGCLPLRH